MNHLSHYCSTNNHSLYVLTLMRHAMPSSTMCLVLVSDLVVILSCIKHKQHVTVNKQVNYEGCSHKLLTFDVLNSHFELCILLKFHSHLVLSLSIV